MRFPIAVTGSRQKLLLAILGVAACLHAPFANSQQQETPQANSVVELGQRANFAHGSYILGPGDGLEIELVDVPELSGRFTIGPDGTIYLPRLRALFVEGLTVEELQAFLTKQFRTYVIDPQVYIRPVTYRPIRVYVGGEVKRPGYYTLAGHKNISAGDEQYKDIYQQTGQNPIPNQNPKDFLSINKSGFTVLPTIFDAVQAAQGITPYSDLSKVQVTRRQSLSRGGGRVRTQLNFLSLITEGDESQNIRLLDGDVVNVSKSPKVLREQLIQAGQTNLTPEFMEVYVTGRVLQTGPVTLPQGSSLVHAVDFAGGTKCFTGR